MSDGTPRSLPMEAERREYLKQYILACIRSSVLSWSDLASPDVVHKFLGVVSRDAKAVIVEFGRTGVGVLLGIVEGVATGRNRR